MTEIRRHFVHFDLCTGDIRQVGSGHAPFVLEGFAVAEFSDVEFDVNTVTARHKVDLKSLVSIGDDGALLCWLTQYTNAEWRNRRIPPFAILRGKRDVELKQTDGYPAPDHPISDEVRQSWVTYRQALRDLGAHDTTEQMIAAWPIRPDGIDAIAALRDNG